MGGTREEIQDARIAPAMSDGTANSNVRKFTAGTSTAVNALPKGWDDCYLRLLVEGGNVYVLFSSLSTQTVVEPSASAAGAAAATQGETLLPGEHHRWVDKGFIYFARLGTAAGCTVKIVKG